jgi:prepilin-type N-terminal cleavage/methylation domain-containing protein
VRFNERDDGKTKGFTLIEVMIVLAVISIIAMYTVPKYQATQDHYKLEAAAQTVVTELRYAKQLAMDQRTDCFVVFNDQKMTLLQVVGTTVKEVERKSFGPGILFDSVQNSTLATVTLEGITRGKGFRYDPKGFAINDGRIILSNPRGSKVGIEVARQTGTVSVVWP